MSLPLDCIGVIMEYLYDIETIMKMFVLSKTVSKLGASVYKDVTIIIHGSIMSNKPRWLNHLMICDEFIASQTKYMRGIKSLVITL